MKQRLLSAGVRNLREFGYELATEETILTDELYKEFFREMLLAVQISHPSKDVIAAVEELMNEMFPAKE
jgi:hypothetical protein